MPFTAQQQPFSIPSIPCNSPKAQVSFPGAQPSIPYPHGPAGPYAGGPRLETPGSRDRCPPFPAPRAAAAAFALAPVGCFSSLKRGGGAKAPGIQGAGPGYYSDDDRLLGRGGGGDRKPGPFRLVWVQSGPPTTGRAVVGSARDRELGPSDSSLPREESGTLGPCGRSCWGKLSSGRSGPPDRQDCR